MTQINDHLWEGRYSPKVNGKRMARNVYAQTEAECEEKLAALIVEMKKKLPPCAGRKRPDKNSTAPSGTRFPGGLFFSAVVIYVVRR